MHFSKFSLATYLFLLVLSTGLLFSSCKEPNVDHSIEIKEHFGDMLYTSVTITDSKFSDLKPISGEGIIRDSLGEPINIKWFALITEKGEIGGFSIGPRHEKAPKSVAMTVDEASDRLEVCKTKEEEEELRKCLKEFMKDVYDQCLGHIFGSPEAVDEHCWLYKS